MLLCKALSWCRIQEPIQQLAEYMCGLRVVTPPILVASVNLLVNVGTQTEIKQNEGGVVVVVIIIIVLFCFVVSTLLVRYFALAYIAKRVRRSPSIVNNNEVELRVTLTLPMCSRSPRSGLMERKFPKFDV